MDCAQAEDLISGPRRRRMLLAGPVREAGMHERKWFATLALYRAAGELEISDAIGVAASPERGFVRRELSGVVSLVLVAGSTRVELLSVVRSEVRQFDHAEFLSGATHVHRMHAAVETVFGVLAEVQFVRAWRERKLERASLVTDEVRSRLVADILHDHDLGPSLDRAVVHERARDHRRFRDRIVIRAAHTADDHAREQKRQTESHAILQRAIDVSTNSE